MDLSKKIGIHSLSRSRNRTFRVVNLSKIFRNSTYVSPLDYVKTGSIACNPTLFLPADILLNSVLRGSRPKSFASHLIMPSDLRFTGPRTFSPSVIRNICMLFVAQRAPPSSHLLFILARHLLIILQLRSHTLISIACATVF